MYRRELLVDRAGSIGCHGVNEVCCHHALMCAVIAHVDAVPSCGMQVACNLVKGPPLPRCVVLQVDWGT